MRIYALHGNAYWAALQPGGRAGVIGAGICCASTLWYGVIFFGRRSESALRLSGLDLFVKVIFM